MTNQFFGSLPEYDLISEKQLSEVSIYDLSVELLSRFQHNEPGNISEAIPDQLLTVLFYLNQEIEKQACVFNNRFSLKYLEGLFYVTYRYWKQHHIPLKGATYIDVGCGSVNPFGLLFAYIMLGINKGICLDPDPIRDLPQGLSNLANVVGKTIIDPSKVFGDYPITRQEIISNLADFDLAKLSEGSLEAQNLERLSFRQESIMRTTLKDGEADVVLSISVLEHLPNIDVAIAELGRITKSGGYGIHNIDGVDHWSYSNSDLHSLEFLKIDTTEEIVHISNRIRPLSFIEIFERHGFDVLEINPYGQTTIDQELRRSFIEPFRSMQQKYLEVTQACLLVRKY